MADGDLEDRSQWPIPVISSLSKECQQLKELYDNCFNNWFSTKFLKGNTDDSECKPLFKQYRACVQVNMLSIQSL